MIDLHENVNKVENKYIYMKHIEIKIKDHL